MTVQTNTPDVFVAGRRTSGYAVPAIAVALFFMWGLLAIMSRGEGTDLKTFALNFFGIVAAFFLMLGLLSVYRNQLVLIVDNGMDAESGQITRARHPIEKADALVHAINGWLRS